MNIIDTELPDVKIIEPRRFGDDRGFFAETFQSERYTEAGIGSGFVQDNHSRSSHGVLRGLHYQIRRPQGKLVSVARGAVFDVAVDMRSSSSTFGKWVGVILSDDNGRQLYVPPGFAHGFCVISEDADFIYKCTDYYCPKFERSVLWNDPAIGINWPVDSPIVSDKDAAGSLFSDAEYFDDDVELALGEVDSELNRQRELDVSARQFQATLFD